MSTVNIWPKPVDKRKEQLIKEKQDREANISILRRQLIEEKNKYFPQMQFNFEQK